ncbi:hypothetical protein HYH03_015964 [Edaphochlamys debaryana]|uniref:Alpha-type protein kinase domain-containing protein n=1 Tax=Edaphochlamys debaryana TaxID=47281 RepID=A0A836BRX6_9CHLO|nr:hypothetical protein HYH03_015964 [Edaphochlamys debaryana]|eukprot:KAG2485289.1 hypothetical protein HYH03_015964 [Edaphochlamys debaryana]
MRLVEPGAQPEGSLLSWQDNLESVLVLAEKYDMAAVRAMVTGFLGCRQREMSLDEPLPSPRNILVAASLLDRYCSQQPQLQPLVDGVMEVVGSALSASSASTALTTARKIRARVRHPAYEDCVSLRIQPAVLQKGELLRELSALRAGGGAATRTVSGSRSRVGELEREVRDLASVAASTRRRAEEIKRLVLQSQELDLAFLVDVTGSMQSSIDTVRDKVLAIADDIRARFPSLRLRVAFVGYRDYDDPVPLTSLDFVGIAPKATQHTATAAGGTAAGDGSARFRTFVGGIRAEGGGDAPEDVFSGLEAAAGLSWASANRLLVHVADAPMHGHRYHELGGLSADSHPAGDKKGRSGAQILESLRRGSCVTAYYFAHLNASTHKMIDVFRKECGDPSWIQADTPCFPRPIFPNFTVFLRPQADTLSNVAKLPAWIVEVCATTIASTLSAAPTLGLGGRAGRRPVAPVPVLADVPDWATVPAVAVSAQRAAPTDATTLLASIRAGKPLVLLPYHGISGIKIAPHAFASDGAARWPFFAVTAGGFGGIASSPPSSLASGTVRGRGGLLVVKRYKLREGMDEAEVHKASRYLQQLETQAVAEMLAANSVEAKGVDAKTVSFNTVSLIRIQDDILPEAKRWCTLEPHLQGTFTKFTNNAGCVNTADYRATLQAFTHWTHHVSGGLVMVTDLQGVLSGDRFLLTDPALHCIDLNRFTDTNLGSHGIELFFRTHECNSICRGLGLSPHTLQPKTGSRACAATTLRGAAC